MSMSTMMYALAEAVRSIVDRLDEAQRSAIAIGRDDFYRKACDSGDATQLTKLITYVKTLDLVHDLMLQIDKSLTVQLKANVAKVDLKLITMIDDLEGLFVSVSDLADNTVATIDGALAVAQKHSEMLSELAKGYSLVYAHLKPPKAKPETPTEVPAGAPTEPALDQPAVSLAGGITPTVAANEEAAGEDFDSAVERAGAATSAPKPPPPPAPSVAPAPANP